MAVKDFTDLKLWVFRLIILNKLKHLLAFCIWVFRLPKGKIEIIYRNQLYFIEGYGCFGFI